MGPAGGAYLELWNDTATDVALTVPEHEAGSLYAVSLARVGDLNGDGLRDIAAGAPMTAQNDVPRVGAVHVECAATGGCIRSSYSPNRDAMMGRSVAMLSDLDGDGVADIAAGGFGYTHAKRPLGRVWIFLGATGELLARVTGAYIDDGFGFAISSASDLDGDGKSDVAIAAPHVPTAPAAAGGAV